MSSSGFKLERFYEGWKEGKMICIWFAVLYRRMSVIINGHNLSNLCVVQAKKGETRPPKLKTEDPNKSYVQRPVKRG